MIGLLTLSAFIIGIATPNAEIEKLMPVYHEGVELTVEEIKVEIGQTMAFLTLAFSELVHVFNIRNNKKSIFKTGIASNKVLLGAIALSAALMLVIVLVPPLRELFSIPVLPTMNIIEIVGLAFAPFVIVELMKLFKLNTTKDEN